MTLIPKNWIVVPANDPRPAAALCGLGLFKYVVANS